MKVTIDSAEPKKRRDVADEFFSTCPSVTSVTIGKLPVGDYLFTTEDGAPLVAFEYKMFADLVNSFNNGHLESQIIDMDQYEYPFLLVCGTYSQWCKRSYRSSFTLSELTHIRSECALHHTRLIEADTVPQSMKLMFSIARKVNALKGAISCPSEQFKLPERKTRTGSAETDLWLYLRGVGRKTYDSLEGKLTFREMISYLDREDPRKDIFNEKGVVVPRATIKYLKELL